MRLFFSVLFCFTGGVIRCSVMIFSLAGHNKEHFLVEDPLWDEALFENVDTQNTKNILTNHKEMEGKTSEQYTLQNFILKRGKRKK